MGCRPADDDPEVEAAIGSVDDSVTTGSLSGLGSSGSRSDDAVVSATRPTTSVSPRQRRPPPLLPQQTEYLGGNHRDAADSCRLTEIPSDYWPPRCSPLLRCDGRLHWVMTSSSKDFPPLPLDVSGSACSSSSAVGAVGVVGVAIVD